jgi:hypothetical protein
LGIGTVFARSSHDDERRYNLRHLRTPGTAVSRCVLRLVTWKLGTEAPMSMPMDWAIMLEHKMMA